MHEPRLRVRFYRIFHIATIVELFELHHFMVRCGNHNDSRQQETKEDLRHTYCDITRGVDPDIKQQAAVENGSRIISSSGRGLTDVSGFVMNDRSEYGKVEDLLGSAPCALDLFMQ